VKRKSKAPPEYLTPEEISRFFRFVTSVRDRALFRLAYHRGLRASELGLFQLADYRTHVGRLLVRRLKGSNSGEFLLTQVEQHALRAWIRQRGTAPGPLFPSRNHRPISRFRLDQLMKRYCELAGIPREKAHMHALKHSCGTHLSAREPDIVAIQDHLGHANIQNTMKYVQIASKRRDEFSDRLRDWGK
jgi:type 1 fimbriae regulatory protein FimB/type 1 fimbriae regulatory protein FimE